MAQLMPLASEPRKHTPVAWPSASLPASASSAAALIWAVTVSRSASSATATSTSHRVADPALRRLRAVLLSTELGMTCSLPRRSRTVVLRQLTSTTSPEKPETSTRSPGCTTLPAMRPSPPMTLETVS